MKKVIGIILCIALVFGLCACGGPSPTDVTNDFMKAVKEKDNETLKTVYGGGDLDLTKSVKDGKGKDEFDKLFGDALYKKLFDFDYEVSNEKVDADKATVDVKIKTYDLGAAFTNFINDYMAQAFSMALSGASEDAVNKKAEEIFLSKLEESKKDYEKTVTLNLSQKDDKWVVDELKTNGDFYNALTGGIIDVSKNIEKSFGSNKEN